MVQHPPEPMTEQQRADEIRQLETVRDKLLANAPKHFYFRRFLLPVMLAMALLAVVKGLYSRPSQFSFGHGLLLAGFLAVIFLSFVRFGAERQRPATPGVSPTPSDTRVIVPAIFKEKSTRSGREEPKTADAVGRRSGSYALITHFHNRPAVLPSATRTNRGRREDTATVSKPIA
jgi:hypothetical protein